MGDATVKNWITLLRIKGIPMVKKNKTKQSV